MNRSLRLGMALCALSLACTSLGDELPSKVDLPTQFPAIRQQLASSDYPQREAGQRELDKIPPDQIAALKSLSAAETDPEVKARLDARVSAMELFTIMHPPGISLDLKEVSLAEVADAMNAQLGLSVVQAISAGRGGGADPKFTLKADHQPFCEIIEALNRQNPLNITTSIVISGSGTVSTVRLTPILPGGTPRTYNVVDTLSQTAIITGQPATGSWLLRVQFLADPRIKVLQYSMLRIDKITDQDGNSLLPLVAPGSTSLSTSLRPVASWLSTATMSAMPGLQRLKEVKGSVTIVVQEHEETYAIDLSKPPPEPLKTSRGEFSVDKAINGDWTLHLVQPPGEANPVPALVASANASRMVTIRVLDAEGKTVQSMMTSGSTINTALPRLAAPARVELTYPDKTREVVLPVELKDVEIPPPGMVNPPAVRGGLVIPAR